MPALIYVINGKACSRPVLFDGGSNNCAKRAERAPWARPIRPTVSRTQWHAGNNGVNETRTRCCTSDLHRSAPATQVACMTFIIRRPRLALCASFPFRVCKIAATHPSYPRDGCEPSSVAEPVRENGWSLGHGTPRKVTGEVDELPLPVSLRIDLLTAEARKPKPVRGSSVVNRNGSR